MALSVRAATGDAGARGCRRMIREVAPGGDKDAFKSVPDKSVPKIFHAQRTIDVLLDDTIF